MKGILNTIHMIALMVLKRFSARSNDEQRLIIQPYTCYASLKERRIRVFGRVIQSYTDPNFREKSKLLSHIIQVVRLFLANGESGARVEVRVGSEVFSLGTNSQGFFSQEIALRLDPSVISAPVATELPRVKINYHIQDNQEHTLQESFALVPCAQTKMIYISDIDDTVIKSKATSILSLIYRTIFLPPHKRKVFPEVSRAYNNLKTGKLDKELNLFFYVSSSTWDLYPLLSEFIKINKLPHGPLILQDVKGESEKRVSGSNHHIHKFDRVEEVLKVFPDYPMTLIGDAGQADAEIYLTLAEKYPKHVAQILIRRTWWQKMASDPEEYLDRAKGLGVKISYFDNLEELDLH